MKATFSILAGRDLLLGTSSLGDNTHVHSFYHKLGFEDLIKLFYYFTPDYPESIIMCRSSATQQPITDKA